MLAIRGGMQFRRKFLINRGEKKESCGCAVTVAASTLVRCDRQFHILINKKYNMRASLASLYINFLHIPLRLDGKYTGLYLIIS